MKTSQPVPRLARQGLTLIELTCVILVILSLITILFVGGRAWKRGADRSQCLMNIRNIQQAMRSKQNLELIPEGAAINIDADLIGPGNFVEATPICPANGTYSFEMNVPALGTLATHCDLAGAEDHIPSAYDGW